MRRGLLLPVGFLLVVAITLAGWWRRAPDPTLQDEAQGAPAAAAAPGPSTSAAPATSSPNPELAAAPAIAGTPRRPEATIPAPIPVEGNLHEQAAVLADRIVGGGDDGVVALATALDLAGFAIRLPDGSVKAPSRPTLGIAFSAWEFNALADLVASRQVVAAPLDGVAAAIASTIPGGTGEGIRGFIVDALRGAVHAPEGRLTFWAALIVELGRRSRTHAQYDLLGHIDPAATHLDLVQLAFLTKQLAGEVAASAHPERVKAPAVQPAIALWRAWLVQPVAAQGTPCQFTESETEILDWTAFGSNQAFGAILGWLEAQGMAGATNVAKVTGIANVVLAYLKLALTQKAFRIAFEVENGPMVRTQKVRPQQGEQRTIAATVSLDFGDASWINCFRIMLNGMGLDINVDNSGPYKGAEVTFNGYGGFRSPWAIGAGPEHLVQFIGDANNRIQGSGPTSRSHAGQNQVTDAQGKARVDIVGNGQEEFLGSQPREVMKEASLSAMVVMQPANLIKDLRSAGGMAGAGVSLLALPAELLFRTRWTFGGNYTFPVKDWKVGNGWTGTISYRDIEQRAARNSGKSICCGGRETISQWTRDSEEVREGSWELPAGADTQLIGNDMSAGAGRITLSVRRQVREHSFHTGWASCRGGAHPQTSRTHDHELDATANYAGTAQITVRLSDDGSFMITGGGPEQEALGEIRIMNKSGRNDGCKGDQPPRIDTFTRAWKGGDLVARISGTADPDADALKGTRTIVQKNRDGSIINTRIYQWDLRR